MTGSSQNELARLQERRARCEGQNLDLAAALEVTASAMRAGEPPPADLGRRVTDLRAAWEEVSAEVRQHGERAGEVMAPALTWGDLAGAVTRLWTAPDRRRILAQVETLLAIDGPPELAALKDHARALETDLERLLSPPDLGALEARVAPIAAFVAFGAASSREAFDELRLALDPIVGEARSHRLVLWKLHPPVAVVARPDVEVAEIPAAPEPHAVPTAAEVPPEKSAPEVPCVQDAPVAAEPVAPPPPTVPSPAPPTPAQPDPADTAVGLDALTSQEAEPTAVEPAPVHPGDSPAGCDPSLASPDQEPHPAPVASPPARKSTAAPRKAAPTVRRPPSRPAVSAAQTPRPTLPREQVEDAIHRMLAASDLSRAHHLARLVPLDGLPRADLLAAAALASGLQDVDGAIAREVRPRLDAIADDAPLTIHDQILALCAGLVPALLAPGYGAMAVLERIVDLGRPVRQVVDAVAAFARVGRALSPHAARGVNREQAWVQEGRAIAQQALGWRAAKQHATIKYHRATMVFRRDLGPGGVLGRMLDAVAENRTAEIDRVREDRDLIANSNSLRRHILRLEDEVNPNRTGPIEAGALFKLESFYAEAEALASRWLAHLDDVPLAADLAPVQAARAALEASARAAQDALRTMGRGDGWNADLAPLACAQVERTLGLLHGDERRPERSPVHLLHGGLTRVPGLTVGEDLNPRADDDALVRLLVASAVFPDAATAFDAHLACGSFATALRLIEVIEAAGEPERGDLRPRRTQALEDFRRRLVPEITAMRDLLDRSAGVAVDEESRYRLEAELARCDPMAGEDLQDLPGWLARIGQEVREHRAHAAGRILARTRAPARERVETAIAGGDLRLAEAWADTDRFVQVSAGTLFEEFQGSFLDRLLAAAREGRLHDRVLENLLDRQRADTGAFTLEGGPEFDPRVGGAIVRAWRELRATFDKRDFLVEKKRGLVESLFKALGFGAVGVDHPEPEGWQRWRGTLNLAARIVGRHLCGIPEFGSQAQGIYDVVVEAKPGTVDDLASLLAGPGDRARILVYVAASLGREDRRRLAAICRADNKRGIVLDEAAILYSASRAKICTRALFSAVLPIASTRPYVTGTSWLPPEMFFGRDGEYETIASPTGSSLVYGGRQFGKTSLLREVQRRVHNPAKGVCAFWLDLKGRGFERGNKLPDQIWREIAIDLTVMDPMFKGLSKPDEVVARIRGWLTADSGRRLLLLLDEADDVLRLDATGDRGGRGSYANLERFRDLMATTEKRFKVVFAGLQNVQRAAKDRDERNPAVQQFGTPVCIGAMLGEHEWRHAHELVVGPFATMGFTFESPVLPLRILSYSNYYPSLIQIFCARLLDRLTERLRTDEGGPPFQITHADVAATEIDREVKERFQERFLWTLDLDDRYRVLAHAALLADMATPPAERPDGYDVRWFYDEAVGLWRAGFASCGCPDAVHCLLDEMVGLGVLRRVGDRRYAIRSPSVASWFGRKETVEDDLLRVTTKPAATPTYGGSFARRQGPPGDDWDSPFTFQQEAEITDPNVLAGVRVVLGTPLGGLTECRRFLEKAAGAEPVSGTTRALLEASVRRWTSRVAAAAVAVSYVPTEVNWGPDCLASVGQILERQKQPRRVVFLGGPQHAERLVRNSVAPAPNLRTLLPFGLGSVSHWLRERDDRALRDADATMVLDALGGWPLLLAKLARTPRDRPIAERVASVRAALAEDQRLREACGIDDLFREVARQQVGFGEPIPADLFEVEVPIDELTSRLWVWELVGLVRRVGSEDAWIVDEIALLLAGARPARE